jgi:hypothetical protein
MSLPASDIYAISPSDSAILPTPARGILVGATPGNIALRCHRNGATVTIPVLANTRVDVEVYQVMFTGTTATPLFALL